MENARTIKVTYKGITFDMPVDPIKIALCGNSGAGKTTVARILEGHRIFEGKLDGYNFKHIVIAEKLKEFAASVFGWDEYTLQGTDLDSRIWRESKDEEWSKIFDKEVTPRNMMVAIGTAGRLISPLFWVASAMKANAQSCWQQHSVVSDVRFINEVDYLVENHGYVLVDVKRRGSIPENFDYNIIQHQCRHVVENDGTIEDLEYAVDLLLTEILYERVKKYFDYDYENFLDFLYNSKIRIEEIEGDTHTVITKPCSMKELLDTMSTLYNRENNNRVVCICETTAE